MLPIRIKACSESDLRMLGNLAHNIQRVLPVTQADIDAAAALGKGWVVWKVIEVTDPIDNLRGGTQLVIKQNSITPGQNVRRVLIVSGPGGETVVIGPGPSPLLLPDAIADSLSYVKAFGGTEQRNLPDGYTQLEYLEVATDGAYFATGVNATVDTDMGITASNITVSSGQVLVAQCVSGGDYFRIAKTSASQRIAGTIGSSTVTDNNTDGANKFTARINKSGFYINDNLVGTFSNIPSSLTGVGEIDIFRGKYSDSIYYASVGFRFHNVWVDDNIFLPCKRNSDNQLGIYNTKTGEFILPSGTGSFIAGPTAVPTPDAPMDIVSNNGVLKARHQSGLPTGYTLLDYIESNGTQYIDLGYKGNGNTKVSVEYRYHTAIAVSGSGRVFGSRTTSSSNAFAIGSASGYVYTTGNKAFWCYDSQSYFVVDNPTFPMGDWQTVVFSATEHTLNGVSYGDDYNVVEFETPQNLKLFGFDNGGTMACGYVDIAHCKLWDNGVLVRDLIPAKNNSNIIGMYDLVSGQFFTNQGTDDFIAGDPVSDPVEIYTDGTVETINVHGKNLFDKTQQDTQYYYGNDGSNRELEREGSKLVRSAKIPCLPNTTYTLSGTRTAVTVTAYYKFTFWDKNGNFISYVNNDPVGLESYVRTATTPNNCYYIAFNSYDTDTNVQLEQGSTATDYQPYYDGGTATAEMLLKVGNYQDVQSIIDGVVTRNVGVRVFDGTEDWSSAGTNRYWVEISNMLTGSNYVRLCTHFKQNTVYANLADGEFFCGASTTRFNIRNDATPTMEQLKQYLADQYANGTPVIVIYPLATATTESVAGQTLQVQAGDNTLEITQASLNNLELEAEYQKV